MVVDKIIDRSEHFHQIKKEKKNEKGEEEDEAKEKKNIFLNFLFDIPFLKCPFPHNTKTKKKNGKS